MSSTLWHSIDKLYCVKCQITVENPGITVELAVFMIPAELPLYTLHVQVGVCEVCTHCLLIILEVP